jgi:hypothetical protein
MKNNLRSGCVMLALMGLGLAGTIQPAEAFFGSFQPAAAT